MCVFKMDHHCPWINNCVGHHNMKHFIQFVIYTCLASAYLSLLMALSFYQLLTSKKPKTHMDKGEYPWVFGFSIVAFIEGLIFAFFTYEMGTETYGSIDDNQSYIDDMKDQFGAQQETFDNLKANLGIDIFWWIIPTKPEL